MKIYCLLVLLALTLLGYSCKEELFDTIDTNKTPNLPSTEGVSQETQVKGVKYSLKNLTINPQVIALNAKNTTLLSSKEDLNNGIIKLAEVSGAIKPSLLVNTILYISIDDYTDIRKITEISEIGDNYEIKTTQAHLGEVFNGGEMAFSLDVYEESNAVELRGTNKASLDSPLDFIDVNKEYDLYGNVFNPSTKIKLVIDFKMSFAESQTLPSHVTCLITFLPTVNPYLLMNKSMDEVFEKDLAELIPDKVIKLIKQKEFNLNIPINILGIGTLPAKVEIEDIKIPSTMDVDIANGSRFSFGITNFLKLGFTLDIDGQNATPSLIVDNKLQFTPPQLSEIGGYIGIKSMIQVTPKISVLNNLYKIAGEASLGIETETIGNAGLEHQSNSGSKGTLATEMNVNVDLLLVKIPVEIANIKKELWNVGDITSANRLVYSDLTSKVGTKYSVNLISR